MKYTSMVAALALLTVAPLAEAAFLTPSFSGSTQFDGWSQANMSATGNPGYPGIFSSANAWPGPIGSGMLGSGDAELSKTSGVGFPSDGFGGGIYAFTVGPGAGQGGAFRISDSTAVTGLETVVFQLDVEGVGVDWTAFISGLSLNYNGGSQQLAFDFSNIYPTEPAQGGFTRQIFAVQWDLTDIVTPITSFQINWAESEHTFIYGIRLDQSDTYQQVVPEPSTGLLVAAALGGLGLIRRRRRASQVGAKQN